MIVHVDFLKRSLSVHVGLQQTKDVDVHVYVHAVYRKSLLNKSHPRPFDHFSFH